MRRATRTGRHAFALLLALAMHASVGCLVTDKVDYDRPNTPAQLQKVTPADLSRVVFDKSCGTQMKDDETTPWMRFAAHVRDVDVDDELQARLLVNGQVIRFIGIPPQGTIERGDFSQCLTLDDLRGPCMHVELIVTRAFKDLLGDKDPKTPRDPLDLARVEWWVLGLSSDYPEVGLADCVKAGLP